MAPSCDSHRVDKHSSRVAYNLAHRVIKDMESYSRIMDKPREDSIPCFEREEILLGQLLGKGGFNQVIAVDRIDLLTTRGRYAHKTSSPAQQEARAALAKNPSNQYAVKFLKSEAMADAEDYSNGAADLMVETKLLSSIKPHPNIITLHGIAASGISGFAEGTEGAYFLLLDRLEDTLDKKLITWKDQDANMFDRLRVAFDLSSAMAHLHAHNIIFRDLKPDNVGFDTQGNVKLFDFGLSKELDPRQQLSEESYEMSGNTGSRRYMAPEVALSKPYGLSADVYSFGVLLWEICSLQEPYKGMKLKEHLNFVVKGDQRPEIYDEWSKKLANILRWSWMPEQEIRPPMVEIRRALKTELRAQKPKADLPKDNQPEVKKKDRLTNYIEKQPQASVISALSAFQASCTVSQNDASKTEFDSPFNDPEFAFSTEIDLHSVLADALNVVDKFE